MPAQKRMRAFVGVIQETAEDEDREDIGTTWKTKCDCDWCINMDAEMLLTGVLHFIAEHNLEYDTVLAKARENISGLRYIKGGMLH